MKKIEFWILCSTEDEASVNIKQFLLGKYSFSEFPTDNAKFHLWNKHKCYSLILDDPSLKECFNIRLMTTDARLIFLDQEPAEKYFADFMVIASRHKSKSAIPAILTHTTGNWDNETDYGGKGNSIAKTSAALLRFAYDALTEQKEQNDLEWPVDLEVNHHGPTEIMTPLVFMELGSSEANYSNDLGVKSVAQAIINTIKRFSNYLIEIIYVQDFLLDPAKYGNITIFEFIKDITKKIEKVIAIGFGGPHYARNFSKIYNSNKSVFISHIIPKYSIMNLTKTMVEMMIDRTVEDINAFLIDWKGVNSKQKKHILKICESFGIQIRKCKELR